MMALGRALELLDHRANRLKRALASALPNPVTRRLAHLADRGRFNGNDPQFAKHAAELRYWRSVRNTSDGGSIGNNHFRHLFTDFVGLDESFYAGKWMLDVGCGPAGSLEWASGAGRRVGLDPLASAYGPLGADSQAMEYVTAPAEVIPFPDGSFDVVSTLNSLDHVDDLDRTIAEVSRVCKAGGTLVLVTEVNHEPTVTEPISFSWDIIERFQPAFTVVLQEHYEFGADVYASLYSGKHWSGELTPERTGVLVARLTRSSTASDTPAPTS